MFPPSLPKKRLFNFFFQGLVLQKRTLVYANQHRIIPVKRIAEFVPRPIFPHLTSSTSSIRSFINATSFLRYQTVHQEQPWCSIVLQRWTPTVACIRQQIMLCHPLRQQFPACIRSLRQKFRQKTGGLRRLEVRPTIRSPPRTI